MEIEQIVVMVMRIILARILMDIKEINFWFPVRRNSNRDVWEIFKELWIVFWRLFAKKASFTNDATKKWDWLLTSAQLFIIHKLNLFVRLWITTCDVIYERGPPRISNIPKTHQIKKISRKACNSTKKTLTASPSPTCNVFNLFSKSNLSQFLLHSSVSSNKCYPIQQHREQKWNIDKNLLQFYKIFMIFETMMLFKKRKKNSKKSKRKFPLKVWYYLVFCLVFEAISCNE